MIYLKIMDVKEENNMKYELNGFIWYIGYNNNKNFWYANGDERNFQGKTKEMVVSI